MKHPFKTFPSVWICFRVAGVGVTCCLNVFKAVCHSLLV